MCEERYNLRQYLDANLTNITSYEPSTYYITDEWYANDARTKEIPKLIRDLENEIIEVAR